MITSYSYKTKLDKILQKYKATFYKCKLFV